MCVLIHWFDAESSEEWTELKDYQDEMIVPVKSIGFIVALTPNFVTIVQNIDEKNEKASNSMQIPTQMIAELKRIDL